MVADFLISLFDKGRALSTIRGYRSAIAAIHVGFPDGSGVSKSHFLSKLLRSFFLQRPPNPKVFYALAKPPFEPLSKASLIHLTVKTVFLMAIAFGAAKEYAPCAVYRPQPHQVGEAGGSVGPTAFLHCQKSVGVLRTGGSFPQSSFEIFLGRGGQGLVPSQGTQVVFG